MLDLASRSHLPSGQGSGPEERGAREGGEAVEGGEEGPVDGQPEGAGLGQEWKMPLPILERRPDSKKIIKYLAWSLSGPGQKQKI